MSNAEVESLRRTAREARKQRNLSVALELERIADQREAMRSCCAGSQPYAACDYPACSEA